MNECLHPPLFGVNLAPGAFVVMVVTVVQSFLRVVM
jgi:hypothetical protein